MTLFLDWACFLAQVLDYFRSRILRTTLSLPGCRRLFLNRATRLGISFALVSAVSLFASLLFPVWSLVFGPVVYGIPHLISSIRYCHYTLVSPENKHKSRLRARFFLTSTAILIVIGAIRLISDLSLSPSSSPSVLDGLRFYYPEMTSLLITVLAITLLYKKSRTRILLSLIFLFPLLVLFIKAPLTCVGSMLLIHNFIAFFYWTRATKSQAEFGVSLLSTAAMLLITGLLLNGNIDFLLAELRPLTSLSFANLDLADQGQQIFPWSSDPILWYRGSIAYSFGQSMHYFVWLKIIPEQHHYHPIAPTFRQSLRFLELDFGRVGLFIIFLVAVGFLFVWTFLSFSLARIVYFSVASYHGYLELGGLLLAAREKNKK